MAIDEQARKLALQNYVVTILYDGYSKGESGFVVGHPELPGCVAEGDTLEEALEYLKDATQGYISLLLEQGLVVPKPQSQSFITDSNAETISKEVGTQELVTIRLIRSAGRNFRWVKASSEFVTMDSWQSKANTTHIIQDNRSISTYPEIESKLIFAQ